MRIANHRDSPSGALKQPDGFAAFLGDKGRNVEGRPGDRWDSSERRLEVISAYLKVLEKTTEPVVVESVLPYPKEVIRRALYHELLEDPNSDSRHQLEIAYIQLESFIPREEYLVMTEFKNTSFIAQELADMGDPSSIIMSARMMSKAKGESAVRIQERISERMNDRRAELSEIGCSTCCLSSL